ncbi:MAG: alanine--tRNA ligase [Clostridiales bacterium]|nr:alanine--tRNA ligase [Clostridiales bacterium]
MKWTGLNELREKYLSFFESKGHLRLKSFSLIPNNDKSLLLINSGMAPMKKYFTGEITPPRKRVTTCQKCIRTPDIERVGITARHGTYFEMLGNFSFGDYFKHEATAWAWEFFTKVLEMPEDRLYCSIYENDDEAFEIWTKEVGVDPSHIVRLGKEDNFWEHGSGPCGPCSEIYFDRGEDKGCGSPTCGVGCDCDRFVEVWNLVFTQFENDGKGNYTKLEHPNIDTGMGLERLACVMQGVDNLFLVDTVQNIMKKVCELSGVNYGENHKNDISLRVITDHIRSTTFMISDGVMPSNEGRGYVLRRLLRRAARHGRMLGVHEPFLYKICETVINENKEAYPELEDKKQLITKLIKVEEESFCKTIEQGMKMLGDIMSKDIKVLSGEDAFKLNDTYGFPIDLTREILAEKNIDVDIDGFNELLAQQKKRARDARKNAGADAWISNSADLSSIAATVFKGYETLDTDAKVVGIVKDGVLCDCAYEGEQAVIITDVTSFYAESGGQVGDSGNIISDSGEAEVHTTAKNPSGVFLHNAKISKGVVTVGDKVKCCVNETRRRDIMRNHTAGHLLQAALRQILGDHVEQAGQLVDENRVRFDFTHFSALTPDELKQAEMLVNDEILKAIDTDIREMPIEEAKKMGAMALFGEKYGDVVRVVNIPGFSIELCGGTHVKNTSHLGLFKILSESSVAAGVRRIEAVTGRGVLELCDKHIDMINESAAAIKLQNSEDLVRGCAQLSAELKEKNKTIEKLNGELSSIKLGSLLKNAESVNGHMLIACRLDGMNADAMREMCMSAINQYKDCVIVIASVNDGKAAIAAACGEEARQKGANAGKIVKAVAQIAGGNGGGKPDMAMAGAKDISKLDEAIASVKGSL